ncbi:hypothetical protein, variant [Sphaeroforma arctica JP610]|uniref:Gem-associated protein 5 TPR domain-containing protein n=1 Tax=Sphaeroforma arctica JP610 TaxID=667725 RepID=A0A0L0FYP5_9EUKA|nr:hypothetical protein, variant [Sphaeroforma arctica JP610]KNC81955.1 hypothetical protein, variant [Sphaeroforma arctica JP610]|eukprot:XP_014155857.1 hypothetical protein, variant [Sphaeroforma arctica JP610]
MEQTLQTLQPTSCQGTLQSTSVKGHHLDATDEGVLVLKGHTHRVVCIAWSPHVTGRLASASFDQTVQIWDVLTETALCNYRGHLSRVYSVAFSLTNADVCISGSADQTVRVWHVSAQAHKRPPSKAQKKGTGPALKLKKSGPGEVNNLETDIASSRAMAHPHTNGTKLASVTHSGSSEAIDSGLNKSTGKRKEPVDGPSAENASLKRQCTAETRVESRDKDRDGSIPESDMLRMSQMSTGSNVQDGPTHAQTRPHTQPKRPKLKTLLRSCNLVDGHNGVMVETCEDLIFTYLHKKMRARAGTNYHTSGPRSGSGCGCKCERGAQTDNGHLDVQSSDTPQSTAESDRGVQKGVHRSVSDNFCKRLFLNTFAEGTYTNAQLTRGQRIASLKHTRAPLHTPLPPPQRPSNGTDTVPLTNTRLHADTNTRMDSHTETPAPTPQPRRASDVVYMVGNRASIRQRLESEIDDLQKTHTHTKPNTGGNENANTDTGNRATNLASQSELMFENRDGSLNSGFFESSSVEKDRTGMHLRAFLGVYAAPDVLVGIRTGTLETPLDDFQVSMAMGYGRDTWVRVCKAYAQQLVRDKHVHKAVSYLLLAGEVVEAVKVYQKCRLYRDAFLLGRLRLLPTHPQLQEVLTDWSAQCVTKQQFAQAAKCEILLGNTRTAAVYLSQFGAGQYGAALLLCDQFPAGHILKRTEIVEDAIDSDKIMCVCTSALAREIKAREWERARVLMDRYMYCDQCIDHSVEAIGATEGMSGDHSHVPAHTHKAEVHTAVSETDSKEELPKGDAQQVVECTLHDGVRSLYPDAHTGPIDMVDAALKSSGSDKSDTRLSQPASNSASDKSSTVEAGGTATTKLLRGDSVDTAVNKSDTSVGKSETDESVCEKIDRSMTTNHNMSDGCKSLRSILAPYSALLCTAQWLAMYDVPVDGHAAHNRLFQNPARNHESLHFSEIETGQTNVSTCTCASIAGRMRACVCGHGTNIPGNRFLGRLIDAHIVLLQHQCSPQSTLQKSDSSAVEVRSHSLSALAMQLSEILEALTADGVICDDMELLEVTRKQEKCVLGEKLSSTSHAPSEYQGDNLIHTGDSKVLPNNTKVSGTNFDTTSNSRDGKAALPLQAQVQTKDLQQHTLLLQNDTPLVAMVTLGVLQFIGGSERFVHTWSQLLMKNTRITPDSLLIMLDSEAPERMRTDVHVGARGGMDNLNTVEVDESSCEPGTREMKSVRHTILTNLLLGAETVKFLRWLRVKIGEKG